MHMTAHTGVALSAMYPLTPLVAAEPAAVKQRAFCQKISTVANHVCPPWQVVELLAKEKGWGWWQRRCETQRAKQLLGTFHASPLPPDPRGDRCTCFLTTATRSLPASFVATTVVCRGCCA